MAESKVKVHEIAKELNVTSKEIIEKLGECGIEVKSHSSTLDEGHLGIIFDIFTTLYAGKEEDLKTAEPVKEEKTAPAKKEEKKEEVKAEEPKKEAKPKKKEEPKPEVKTEKKPEKKAEPKPEKKPEKKPEPPKPKKKKEEVKVQIEEPTDEDFVIKEDKAVRYVDTRTSTVEI